MPHLGPRVVHIGFGAMPMITGIDAPALPTRQMCNYLVPTSTVKTAGMKKNDGRLFWCHFANIFINGKVYAIGTQGSLNWVQDGLSKNFFDHAPFPLWVRLEAKQTRKRWGGVEQTNRRLNDASFDIRP